MCSGPRPGIVNSIMGHIIVQTFATADPLPPHGRFQKLENGETDYGPGDPGYLGGRWWVDSNNNGKMDGSDHYFLCPLLSPSRETP